MASGSGASPFGRYEVVRRLAVGGMGEIYLARDTVLDRHVVLKHLRSSLREEGQFAKMFLEEARALARIDHPHITRIFDIGIADDRHFMALEWLRGWDLWRVFKRLGRAGEHLPVPIALQLVADACEGLHAAHAATTTEGTPLNLVHRDVSPNNLFVTLEGRLKVLDFGVAKTAVQEEQTATGTVKGTVEYFSPEQCRGETLDHRSDIFSLGAVLHEILSGSRLFARDSLSASFAAIAEEPILPPARAGEVLPERLVQITMRALQRRRALRYADAVAFAAELRGVLDAQGAPDRDAVAAACARLFPDDPEGVRASVDDSERHPATTPERGRGRPAAETERTVKESDPIAARRRTADERTERLGAAREEPTERHHRNGSGPGASTPHEATERLEAEPVESTLPAALSPPQPPGDDPGSASQAPPAARRSYAAAVLAALGLLLVVALWRAGTGDAAVVAVVTSDAAPALTSDAAVTAEDSRPLRVDAGVAPAHDATPADRSRHRAPDATATDAGRADAAVADSASPRPPRGRAADRRGPRPRPRAGTRDAAPVADPAHSRAAFGGLTIDAVPWANVYIDGELIGPTPLIDHRLPAGRVRVRLVNPELRLERTETIWVVAGKTIRRRVALSE